MGQIGEPAGSQTGVNPVTFDSAQGGYILHGAKPTYMVATSSCGGNLSSASGAGDAGNICLALNGGSACQQPVTLSPAALTFPGQLLGSALTTQTLTLTNSSSSALNGLTLGFTNNADNQFGSNTTDFNGVPSFTETDACGAGGGPSNSSPFNLASGQSCSITLNFAPQQSCPWLPFPGSGNPQSISGASPQYCPFPQSATVTVNCPASVNSSPNPLLPERGRRSAVCRCRSHQGHRTERHPTLHSRTRFRCGGAVYSAGIEPSSNAVIYQQRRESGADPRSSTLYEPKHQQPQDASVSAITRQPHRRPASGE